MIKNARIKMDPRDFEKELSKYRVVRSSTWRGALPRSTNVVARSNMSNESVSKSTVPSIDSGLASSTACDSTQLLRRGDGLDYMESLRRVLGQALHSFAPHIDAQHVLDSFTEDFESTIESLSLDDVEGIARRMSIAEAT